MSELGFVTATKCILDSTSGDSDVRIVRMKVKAEVLKINKIISPEKENWGKTQGTKTLTNLINTYLVSISIGISLTATDRKTQSTSGISAIELYFFPHEILLGQQSCLNRAALLHEVLRNLIFWLSTTCPASLWVKMIAFTFQAAG